MSFKLSGENVHSAILGVLSASLLLALLCSMSLQDGIDMKEFRTALAEEDVVAIGVRSLRQPGD